MPPPQEPIPLLQFPVSFFLTCDLALTHFTPQRFSFAFGPILKLLGEASEELVLPDGDRHATLHSG